MSNPNSPYDQITANERKRKVRKTPEEERLERQRDLERFHAEILGDRMLPQAAERAKAAAPRRPTSGSEADATTSGGFQPPDPAPSGMTGPAGKEADLPQPSLLSSQDVMRRQAYWHLFASPEARRRAAVMRAKAHQEYLQREQRRQVAEWRKNSAPVRGGVRPGSNARHFNSPGMPSLTGRHPELERQAAAIGPSGNTGAEIAYLLNRPLAAVATGVNSMLDPKYNETFWQGAKRGAYGYGVESWGDVIRGRDPVARWLGQYPTAQGVYRFGRDLLADAIFDPLNFVPPAKLLKYGKKGFNLLERWLQTRAGQVAALGTGLTGAGLLYPDESEASVNLGKIYPKAYFFRGLDHRNPQALKHAFDVMDALRAPGKYGHPGSTELIGSIVGPNALSRAYPWGLLMDVPDPSYIAGISPRSMHSQPYTGLPRLHYIDEGRRTGQPIDIEVQMPRSRQGAYSPEAYVREPGSYDLDELFHDMRTGLDPDTLDHGNIFNQANYRYGRRGQGDPIDLVSAAVADPRYPEAQPFIDWAKEYEKPIVQMPYTRDKRFVWEQLVDPLRGEWVRVWDPRINDEIVLPTTYETWVRHEDRGMVPMIPVDRARAKKPTQRRRTGGRY